MSKTTVPGIAIRLIIITVIAGLLLGLTYNITSGPIAEQEALAKSEARKTVLPDADDFTEVDLAGLGLGDEFSEVQEAYIGVKDGEPVGVTVTLVTKGYSSGLQVTVGIDSDGMVSGVNIDSHSETPGLGAKADDTTYLLQYIGKQGGDLEVIKSGTPNDNEIQAVTGATLTSKGVAGAVNTASRLYSDYLIKEGL